MENLRADLIKQIAVLEEAREQAARNEVMFEKQFDQARTATAFAMGRLTHAKEMLARLEDQDAAKTPKPK